MCPCACLIRRLQRAIEVRSRGAAVNEEVGPSDKCSLIAHQQRCHIGHLICGTGPTSRALGKHILVEVAPGTVKLIQRQGG